MSNKGYWKWRILEKRNRYRGQWRPYWWPFWIKVSDGWWDRRDHLKDYLLSHVQDREEKRLFRKAQALVVEEGSYPE